jgi:hypothetical protein
MREVMESWHGIPDRYDIMYTSLLQDIPSQVAVEDRPLVEEALRRPRNPDALDGFDRQSGTMIYLARPLPEARRFLRAFYDARERAALVPVRYREPRVNRTDARIVAQELLAQWKAVHGGTYGPLSRGDDGRLYWQFHAADRDRMAEEYNAWFLVDRWDGHEVTSDELWDWERFSRGSRTSDEHWHGIPDRYDLYVAGGPMKVVPDIAQEDRRLVEAALDQTQGGSAQDETGERKSAVIHLGRSIDEVRQLLHALRGVRVLGSVVPMRYREPRFDREAARHAAQVYLDDLSAVDGRPTGPLTASTDWVLWWQFRTKRIAKQSSEWRFYIDKWDGHVTTDEWELNDLDRFSRPR